MATIQWFPGHMTKAKRQMEQHLQLVDFVIEIRDARIPDASKNPMLQSLTHSKPRLIILSKRDKADPQATKQWVRHLEAQDVRVIALDLIHDSFKDRIRTLSKELCQSLIAKQQRRGIRPRPLRAMVCGIPNVGKSTLINSIAKRKAAQTANRPGVTKSLQWIRFGSDIELLDTPGILWPKFDDQDIGIKLALLGSIRDEVIAMDDIALFACSWLIKKHPHKLEDHYHIQVLDDPYDTLLAIGTKRGYYQGGSIDEQRLLRAFIQDVRDDKYGPITWEFPDD